MTVTRPVDSQRPDSAILPAAPHARRTWVALIAVLLIAVAGSILIGSRTISIGDTWEAITGDGAAHAIIQTRIARTVLGMCVGAALGIAGALLQGLTRNPLADPGILGINAGAALAIVIAMTVFQLSSLTGYVWFAFVGAGCAMALVHGLAAIGYQGPTPVKIAIAGAAFTAAAMSATSGILITHRDSIDAFRLWQVGTLGGRGLAVLSYGAPFLIIGVALALLSVRSLNALALGTDLARGMGRTIWRDQLAIGLAVILLAGTATALAGPIAFIGLIIPHAVRSTAGPDYARIVPLSIGYGAALAVIADTAGRIVLPPTEVQVGIMAAVVGVPAFFWVVRRGRIGGL